MHDFRVYAQTHTHTPHAKYTHPTTTPTHTQRGRGKVTKAGRGNIVQLMIGDAHDFLLYAHTHIYTTHTNTHIHTYNTHIHTHSVGVKRLLKRDGEIACSS